MFRMVLLVMGGVSALPAAATAQTGATNQYVVLEGVTLYARPDAYSPKVSTMQVRAAQLVGRRSGWLEVRTFGPRTGCGHAGKAIGRLRLFVRTNRVIRDVNKNALRMYRRCGRFAGWVKPYLSGVVRFPFREEVPHSAKQVATPRLRAGATLYWPDGTRAGVNGLTHSLARTSAGSGGRLCGPVRLWTDSSPVKLCFDRRFVRFERSPGGVVGALTKPPPPPPPKRLWPAPNPHRGVEGGVLGGVTGGGGAPRLRPPGLAHPRIVLQHILEKQRVAGKKAIVPPPAVKRAMVRRNQHRLIASLKMCLDRRGRVSVLSFMKRSGHLAYDLEIQKHMRAWRYRPFRVNGKAVPVCTSVTFIYRQH